MIALVRKTCVTPARLAPADLEPVRVLAGEGALDYVLVIASFHFINRIADLLRVDPEALPEALRRFEWLRRLTVRIASRLLARMDLGVREYGTSYQEAIGRLAPVLERTVGRRPDDELLILRARPKLIEAISLALEERERTSLGRDVVARVQRAVEAALPARPEDSEGFHARPADPVEAFAFVGTRYAQRTTEDMIAALRRVGYDDLRLLDLATAVADANQWARMYRLLGLSPDLVYLDASAAAPAVA